jgi:urease accessory protein
MIILHRFDAEGSSPPNCFLLPLTAEERRRSRQRIERPDQPVLDLRLPRGTVLREGDILMGDDPNFGVKISAQPEAVMTVTAQNTLALLRAAYHLGNRHIALEITPHYLRFSSDSVLAQMLHNLGIDVISETCPFYPELGAYGHHHAH